MQHIVVGTDGSPGADEAVRWALEEARRWDARLELVLAWSYLDQPTPEFHPDYGEDDASATLAAVADRAGITEADGVILTCVNDLPARALLDASGHADLVVVGSRGLGNVRGVILGSVSHQVVSRAAVPVVVVHPAPER